MSKKENNKITIKSIELGERLYYGNNNRIKDNKCKSNNALITELSAETVKWLRKHRRVDSKELVPITHYREKQLRQMFNGLDYQNRGYIDLKSFKEGLDYVRNNINNKSYDLFNNVEEMFFQMDDNHDGTIDFKEFTAAITGSSKSAIEKASEFEMDKLFLKFNEYAQMKKREYALECIDGSIMKYGEMSPKMKKSGSQAVYKLNKEKSIIPFNKESSDSNMNTNLSKRYNYNNYKYFRTLFDINEQDDYDTIINKTKELENRLIENQLPVSVYKNKDEILLKLFIDDYMNSKDIKTNKDIEYEKIYLRARQERVDYFESMKKDSELRSLHQRIEEENRRAKLSRLAESKWSTTFKPITSNTRGPLIPYDDSFKANLKLNLSVRKDVYDSMRKRHGLSPSNVMYGLERDKNKTI